VHPDGGIGEAGIRLKTEEINNPGENRNPNHRKEFAWRYFASIHLGIRNEKEPFVFQEIRPWGEGDFVDRWNMPLREMPLTLR